MVISSDACSHGGVTTTIEERLGPRIGVINVQLRGIDSMVNIDVLALIIHLLREAQLVVLKLESGLVKDIAALSAHILGDLKQELLVVEGVANGLVESTISDEVIGVDTVLVLRSGSERAEVNIEASNMNLATETGLSFINGQEVDGAPLPAPETTGE